jgi:lipoate-protein ligase B
LEHPHTFTFGRRGDAANLLWDEAELARRGITVHWVDRGGDVTYHGPGQLVGYPLIPLGVLHPPSPRTRLPIPFEDASQGEGNHTPKVDYLGYIRKLEQVLVMALDTLGVEARPVEGLTGVWIDRDPFPVTSNQPASSSQPSIAKLAAIGVKIDARGVSRHGFALNVDPDMTYWEGIIGCGLTFPEISLAQLLDPVPDMEMVIEALLQAFGRIFNYDMLIETNSIQNTDINSTKI